MNSEEESSSHEPILASDPSRVMEEVGEVVSLMRRAQGKLVRVIKGSVLDVAVDIRKGSPTYGQYHAEILDEELQNQFWIPPGFAHGFLTLEDNTIFSYKCTQYYNKESEDAIRWNDPDVHINWDVENPILSEKDQVASFLKDFESPFNV